MTVSPEGSDPGADVIDTVETEEGSEEMEVDAEEEEKEHEAEKEHEDAEDEEEIEKEHEGEEEEEVRVPNAATRDAAVVTSLLEAEVDSGVQQRPGTSPVISPSEKDTQEENMDILPAGSPEKDDDQEDDVRQSDHESLAGDAPEAMDDAVPSTSGVHHSHDSDKENQQEEEVPHGEGEKEQEEKDLEEEQEDSSDEDLVPEKQLPG